MLKSMAKILCVSLVMSSVVPSGVMAEELTDDFSLISEFEDDDSEEFEEDDTFIDDGFDDDFADEGFEESEIASESETERDSKSESEEDFEDETEELIESEEDEGDLFDYTYVTDDLVATINSSNNYTYTYTISNAKGGRYRFQSYADSDVDPMITVKDLTTGTENSNDDNENGSDYNFRLVMDLVEGHNYRITIKLTKSNTSATVPFKIYRIMTYAIVYDANGGTGAPEPQEIAELLTLVTISSVKPTKYLTLTYDANGGTVSPATKQIALAFDSWNMKRAGTGNSYKAGGTIKPGSSLTLYAQYASEAAVGTMATPKRDGYSFIGWYTAKTGGTKVVSTTKISENTTIYAQWKADSSSYGNTVQGFIYRLYKNMLSREPEESGMTYWVNQLTSGKQNGAQVADGFIHSNEFQAKSLTDQAYIEILYKTFLNRSSDTTGMNYWLAKLNNGMSRDYIFSGFVNSNEFKNICKQYGIKEGTVTLTEARDQNEGVTTFVVRCYKKFLSRSASANDLNYWCKKLLSGELSAKSVAEGFVLSNEFQSKNLSDDDFVETMYQGLFDRSADTSGKKYWTDRLWAGLDREYVFYGFADTPEFKKLVQSFDLNSNWADTAVDQVYDGGSYTLIIPKEWKDQYVVITDETEVTFCEKTNYNYFNNQGLSYGGKLFTVMTATSGNAPFANYEYQGQKNGKHFFIVFPSDVGFAYTDAILTANYTALNNNVTKVTDSFKFKK